MAYLAMVASLMAQLVKHLSMMWETWVRSLGWEDPLEKEMVTHSITIAWKIPWMEEPGGLQSMGSLRVGTTERLHFHFHFHGSTNFPESNVLRSVDLMLDQLDMPINSKLL